MSIFNNFNQDTISLIKRDGSIIENIKALVHSTKIITDNVSVCFDEGDTISRKLPNGKIDYYRVIDPVYTKGIYGIPDHYQIVVEKTTASPKKSSIYINATDNAKVMVSSVDNSINVNSQDTKVFDELLKIAKTLPNNINLITTIQNMRESVNDKESFKTKYNQFIQIAASHMTIFAPFIPALTKILTM